MPQTPLVRLTESKLNRALLVFCLLGSLSRGRAQDLGITSTSSFCGKPNGTITVTANYGVANYQYYLNGVHVGIDVPANTYTFTGLTGGPFAPLYTIGVFDGTSKYEEVVNFPLGDLAGPTITISNVNPAGCLDNDGSLTIGYTGGNGPDYTYSIDNGVTFSGSGLFMGLASKPAGYQAVVKDENGCTSSQLVPVPLQNDLVANVGPMPPICEGSSEPLQVVSNGTQFNWSPAAGLDDPTNVNAIASPSTTTTYTLRVIRGVCTDNNAASVTVTVKPAPVANAGPDVATCTGKSVLLHGSGAGPGGKYSWSPTTYLVAPSGPSPAVNRPAESISYTLTVTSAAGCVSLMPDTIHIEVIPPFQVNAGPDTSVYIGEAAQLHATVPDSVGPVTWQWTPSTGLDNPGVADPTVVLNAPEAVQYLVEATTAGGCTGTDTVNVKVFGVSDLFVPSAFTPNNDGHNDVLRVIGPGVGKLKVFAVFDRWGRQVFLTTNAAIGWDGTLNGRAMDAGTYVWMAEAVDVHGKVIQRKGTVVLIR